MTETSVSSWRRRDPRPHRSIARALQPRREAMSAAAGPTPSFHLQASDGSRDTLISGSIATLLHVTAVGALVAVAAMAPAVIEEIVQPVKILHELPGSNTPARAPRPVAPAAQAAAAPRAAARATPVTPQQLSAQALELDRLESTAPRELDRTKADSQRADAKKTSDIEPEIAKPLEFQPVVVDPSDARAPELTIEAPKQVNRSDVADISAPVAFGAFSEVSARDYSALGAGSEELASDTVGVDSQFANIGVDYGDGTGEIGGSPHGVIGGTPGTVACLDSAIVHRYLKAVEDRTYSMWTVPRGVPIGAKIVLFFELDASGSATRIEANEGEHPEFGASAVQALRSASPFPPMDDAVRCLDGKHLKSTFIHRAK